MYHCHIQFLFIGKQPQLFDPFKVMPPVEQFTYEFLQSSQPEPALIAGADVILADLRGTDPEQMLAAVNTHRQEDAQFIVLAEREQTACLSGHLNALTDIWPLPASEEELQFRFLRWQQSCKWKKDAWQTSQYLEVVINSTPSLVWFKDKNGVHEKVNDAFCTTVNKTKQQVQGQRHAYIWNVDQDDPACIESERLVMEQKQTLISEEKIQTGDGPRLLTTYKSPLYDLDGSVMGTVGVAIDITRERRYHQELVNALHMAQAASEAKSAFLSNVSHDIRTPMNAIIGFLALMRNEVDNPSTVMEYNKRIDAASQHLLGLINDVLDMNKIESGSTTLSISEMDLPEVINEINSIIRPQSNAKKQTFDILATHMNHEHLMGDKMRVNQILINLLSNAVKYTQENGTIQLRVEELPQVVDDHSRIRFTVSDNGLGMSEEYLKVIFDPFTREETNVTHEIQGTGLGMAITKSLVDLMGGTIKVESKPGEGSTFTVELELRIQEREDDPCFWTNHNVSRIIVADDDEEVCRTIVRAMSKTGVQTDYATGGEAAFQMMQEAREAGHPYDLLLLDWKMPGLSGLGTARLIQHDYPGKILILLLTACDWSEIEQEAREVGIDHFMAKPFFISTLKEALRQIMDRQKKLKTGQSDIVRDKHVLVVDDIEVNRIILMKILNTLGAVCDSAANGQEAVDKFNASQPGDYDLILMDVQMPVMDGYTATRAIRSSDHPSAKSLPIIAMTANAFVDDVREAIESGMDAHIAKPVQIDNLKATIHQVLDSRTKQTVG
ncbi:MAG: response regulator [Subdoligranulum sp.]|nr:response regulator [Subdoligranulum sp.]